MLEVLVTVLVPTNRFILLEEINKIMCKKKNYVRKLCKVCKQLIHAIGIKGFPLS